MKDYDFIEIGTSDFRTLIESATDDTVGISVEPIKHYLDRLPSKKNVRKINCAIAFDNVERQSKIFYIKDTVLEEHKLPRWLKGCNSLEKYHYQHVHLGIEELVTVDVIDQIPISKLLIDNNVQRINFLKIDTEGGDCYILEHFKNYLVGKSEIYYPKEILFESNSLTDLEMIERTIYNYEQLDYVVKRRTKSDTHLIRKDLYEL